MPKQRALAWLLLLALGWRVGVAAVSSLSELWGYGPATIGQALTLSEDQRIARALRDSEAKLGYPQGREVALFTALRDALPADAVLFVVSANGPKLLVTFAHMSVLLAPRVLLPANAIPPNWQATAATLGRRCFVLEYAGKVDVDLSVAFERVTSGADFTLWRYKEPGK